MKKCTHDTCNDFLFCVLERGPVTVCGSLKSTVRRLMGASLSYTLIHKSSTSSLRPLKYVPMTSLYSGLFIYIQGEAYALNSISLECFVLHLIPRRKAFQLI